MYPVLVLLRSIWDLRKQSIFAKASGNLTALRLHASNPILASLVGTGTTSVSAACAVCWEPLHQIPSHSPAIAYSSSCHRLLFQTPDSSYPSSPAFFFFLFSFTFARSLTESLLFFFFANQVHPYLDISIIFLGRRSHQPNPPTIEIRNPNPRRQRQRRLIQHA